MFWYLILFITYNLLNARREDLFLFFLRMINEIPAKNGEKYKVIGLTKKENKIYWEKEDEFLFIYNRILIINQLVVAILLSISLFLIKFDVNPFIFYFVTLANAIYNSLYLFTFFHATLTLSIFYISMMNFFLKKYSYLKKQLQLLRRYNVNNPKLARLLYEFDYVNFELHKINSYFKYLIGINVSFYFIICTLIVFLSFSIHTELKLILLSLLFLTHVAIIYVPFCWSSKVIDEINASIRLFQTLSFNSKTNLKNKRRINHLSFYNNGRIGFTCFDFFQLNSELGYTMSLQIVCYIMMLLKFVKISNP